MSISLEELKMKRNEIMNISDRPPTPFVLKPIPAPRPKVIENNEIFNNDNEDDNEFLNEDYNFNQQNNNIRDLMLYTQNMIIETNNYIVDLQKNITKHLYFNLKINTLSTILIVLVCITINNVIFYYYTNINYSF